MKAVRFNSGLQQNIPLLLLSHSKRTHKKTNSDIVRPASLRRQNVSILFNNSNQRNKKSHLSKTIRMIDLTAKYAHILQLRQSIMKEYNSLLHLYETNQEKLGRIILNELTNNNNYLYSKEILTFIKSPDMEPLRGLNFQLLKRDLIKICEFITNFNARKRMRQVQIIKESMLSREKMIRQSSNGEQYEQIFNNMRQPLKASGFTIYDQYKNIKVDFNLPQSQINMNEKLYNKICDAQDCLNTIMKNHSKIRQRQTFKLLGLAIPKQQNIDKQKQNK